MIVTIHASMGQKTCRMVRKVRDQKQKLVYAQQDNSEFLLQFFQVPNQAHQRTPFHHYIHPAFVAAQNDFQSAILPLATEKLFPLLANMGLAYVVVIVRTKK